MHPIPNPCPMHTSLYVLKQEGWPPRPPRHQRKLRRRRSSSRVAPPPRPKPVSERSKGIQVRGGRRAHECSSVGFDCVATTYTHTLAHHRPQLPTTTTTARRIQTQPIKFTSTTTHTADGFPDLAPPIAAPEVMALLRRTQEQQKEVGVVLVDVRTEGVSYWSNVCVWKTGCLDRTPTPPNKRGRAHIYLTHTLSAPHFPTSLRSQPPAVHPIQFLTV